MKESACVCACVCVSECGCKFFFSKYANKGTEALRLFAVIEMFECVHVVVITEG